LDIGLPLFVKVLQLQGFFGADYLLSLRISRSERACCIHDEEAKGQQASARVSRDFWRAWGFSSMA
jgi:hypothetical protein